MEVVRRDEEGKKSAAGRVADGSSGEGYGSIDGDSAGRSRGKEEEEDRECCSDPESN